MLRRLSLTLLAAVLAALPARLACAQDQDAPVAFTLRPTQDAGEDLWAERDDETAGTSAIDADPGPRLAGPEADDPIGPPLLGPELPAEPETPTPARREDADPYEALGARIGPFLVRPAIEIGVAATDDASGTGRAEAGTILAPEISVTTGPGKYTLDANARGTAIVYGDEAIDERDADAQITLGYEPTRRTRIEAQAAYSYSRDSYTDPDTPSGATERPGVHEFGASLAATQGMGQIAFTMRGTIERSIHDDVALAGGGTAELDALDNTETSLALRAAWEAGTLSPFVEAEIGRRDYDRGRDENGYARSSRSVAGRAGLTIDMGSKLRGEVSAGYYLERPEDDRLDDISGVEVAAALVWSPRRLTEVRVNLATSVEPTTVDGASGSFVYSGDVVIARQLTRQWGVEAGLGADHERFVGTSERETTYRGFVGTRFAINRTVSVSGRYSHETVENSEEADPETENRVEVRVRVQY